MSYIVAISPIPGVVNIHRTPKGRPYRHRTMYEAHWRAYLTLRDLPPGRYVEVRKRGKVVERMVKGMEHKRECDEGTEKSFIHRWCAPSEQKVG